LVKEAPQLEQTKRDLSLDIVFGDGSKIPINGEKAERKKAERKTAERQEPGSNEQEAERKTWEERRILGFPLFCLFRPSAFSAVPLFPFLLTHTYQCRGIVSRVPKC